MQVEQVFIDGSINMQLWQNDKKNRLLNQKAILKDSAIRTR